MGALDDLLSRFKAPKEPSIPATSDAAPSSGGPIASARAEISAATEASSEAARPEVPKYFNSAGPQRIVEPGASPFQQGQQGPFTPQPQFQPMILQQPPSPGEDRLFRIEEKLKIVADKLDLISQQISLLWELQKRRP